MMRSCKNNLTNASDNQKLYRYLISSGTAFLITNNFIAKIAEENGMKNMVKINRKKAEEICKENSIHINDLRKGPVVLKTGAKLKRNELGPTRGSYYVIGYTNDDVTNTIKNMGE